MGKYVMSDLHGNYKEYMSMLELIDFNDSDILYILGDVIDRGKESLKIIDHIRRNKNIVMLLGNHEQLFIDYYKTKDNFLWHYNGGQRTHRELKRRQVYLGYEKDVEEDLYRYFKSLPIIQVVDKFILVHAGIRLVDGYNDMSIDELIKAQDKETNIWTRSYIYSDEKYRDYTIVCGHNMVHTIQRGMEDIKMIHRRGHIFIDCGCGAIKGYTKLGCLRLDDLKEYYI